VQWARARAGRLRACGRWVWQRCVGRLGSAARSRGQHPQADIQVHTHTRTHAHTRMSQRLPSHLGSRCIQLPARQQQKRQQQQPVAGSATATTACA
jgi:hypothetical protein